MVSVVFNYFRQLVFNPPRVCYDKLIITVLQCIVYYIAMVTIYCCGQEGNKRVWWTNMVCKYDTSTDQPQLIFQFSQLVPLGFLTVLCWEATIPKEIASYAVGAGIWKTYFILFLLVSPIDSMLLRYLEFSSFHWLIFV